MKTYADKLKDPRWQKKRVHVLQRDEFTCQDCGGTRDTLHVHHCAYTGMDPWDAPLNILLTLCDGCHERRQELENDAHTILGQIMARLKSDGRRSELDTLVSELAASATDENGESRLATVYEKTP